VAGMALDIRSYEPAVSRRVLILISGILWNAVGALLCIYATGWLAGLTGLTLYIHIFLGAMGAFLIYHFGFEKLAVRNIGRIRELKPRICIFAFQAWKSYLMILIMMAMGIAIRHSHFPKKFLISPYYAIGMALMMGSFRYYLAFGRDR